MTRLMSVVPVVYSLLVINSLPTANGCEWGPSGTRNGTVSPFADFGYVDPVVTWADSASDVVLYGGFMTLVASHIAKFVARLYADKQSRAQALEPGLNAHDVRELAKKALCKEASEVVKSLILVASVVGIVEYMKTAIDKERIYVLQPDYKNGKLCMDPDDFKAMPSGHAAVSAIAWSQVVLNVLDSAALSSPAFKRLLERTRPFSNQPLASPYGKTFFALSSAFGFGGLAGVLRILAAKHDGIDVSVGMIISATAAACSPYIRSGVFSQSVVVDENTGYYYNDDVYSRPVEVPGPVRVRDNQEAEAMV